MTKTTTPFEQAAQRMEDANALAAVAKANAQLELESLFWAPDALAELVTRIDGHPELAALAARLRRVLDMLAEQRAASEAFEAAHQAARAA